MELPVYQIEISDSMTDDNGLSFMSLVNSPAIQENYLKFNQQMKYTANNEQQIVSGPAILADTPIYRNMNGKEFYTVFSKDTIKKLVKKWAIQGKYNSVNLEHEAEASGVYLLESYTTNKDTGFNPPQAFIDAPDGSWFLSYYIDNADIWAMVKDNTFNGFSVQGGFGLGYSETYTALREIREMLEKIVS